MSTYPLPGETVVSTRRNVAFGHGRYPPDEPAPDDIALLFRTLKRRWKAQEMLRATFEARGDHASWEAYHRAVDATDRRRNDLLQAMSFHRWHSFVCEGYRLRFVVDSKGCRHRYVSMEKTQSGTP